MASADMTYEELEDQLSETKKTLRNLRKDMKNQIATATKEVAESYIAQIKALTDTIDGLKAQIKSYEGMQRQLDEANAIAQSFDGKEAVDKDKYSKMLADLDRLTQQEDALNKAEKLKDEQDDLLKQADQLKQDLEKMNDIANARIQELEDEREYAQTVAYEEHVAYEEEHVARVKAEKNEKSARLSARGYKAANTRMLNQKKALGEANERLNTENESLLEIAIQEEKAKKEAQAKLEKSEAEKAELSVDLKTAQKREADAITNEMLANQRAEAEEQRADVAEAKVQKKQGELYKQYKGRKEAESDGKKKDEKIEALKKKGQQQGETIQKVTSQRDQLGQGLQKAMGLIQSTQERNTKLSKDLEAEKNREKAIIVTNQRASRAKNAKIQTLTNALEDAQAEAYAQNQRAEAEAQRAHVAETNAAEAAQKQKEQDQIIIDEVLGKKEETEKKYTKALKSNKGWKIAGGAVAGLLIASTILFTGINKNKDDKIKNDEISMGEMQGTIDEQGKEIEDLNADKENIQSDLDNKTQENKELQDTINKYDDLYNSPTISVDFDESKIDKTNKKLLIGEGKNAGAVKDVIYCEYDRNDGEFTIFVQCEDKYGNYYYNYLTFDKEYNGNSQVMTTEKVIELLQEAKDSGNLNSILFNHVIDTDTADAYYAFDDETDKKAGTTTVKLSGLIVEEGENGKLTFKTINSSSDFAYNSTTQSEDIAEAEDSLLSTFKEQYGINVEDENIIE